MTTVGSGKYTYEVVENWAKLPEGETFAMVSAMAADSQDRVFAFQRKDPPILIFDPDGNLLDSWGNGAFSFAHGIYIEDDTVYLTDRDNSVCLVYTIDGKPIQMLGRHGVHSDTGCENPGDLCPRAAGPFNYPTEMIPSPFRRPLRFRRVPQRPHSPLHLGRPAQAVLGSAGQDRARTLPPAPQPADPQRHHLPVRPGEPPDAALHPGRRVHRHLGRHPAPHGHIRGQRGRPGRQRGSGRGLLGPGQRPGHVRAASWPASPAGVPVTGAGWTRAATFTSASATAPASTSSSARGDAGGATLLPQQPRERIPAGTSSLRPVPFLPAYVLRRLTPQTANPILPSTIINGTRRPHGAR